MKILLNYVQRFSLYLGYHVIIVWLCIVVFLVYYSYGDIIRGAFQYLASIVTSSAGVVWASIY